MVTGRQIAAARALLGVSQAELASSANISVPTLKRMEGSEGIAGGMRNNVAAVRGALEAAGVAFLDAGSTATGAGVSLLKSGDAFNTDDSQVVQYRESLQKGAPPGGGG